MASYADTLGISDTAFTLLRDLIHDRIGLFYENDKSDLLTDKLSPLVIERGFNSFLDYYYLLKYDEEAEQEWRRVMDALSVQETYFWREVDQVRALVEIIVPQYFSSSATLPLKIWSAACATGEEPLSITMALNEAGWFTRAPIEIYATDASRAAIERARRGIFRERSFRNLPAPLREKYFLQDTGGSRLAPEIHRRVKWGNADLVNPAEIAGFAAAQIIFCRNVFIYFSARTIRQTVNQFARQMRKPGYLFVGS